MSTSEPVSPSSTRERLVEAAFALFAEQGFEKTTVDEIALRAGVGRSTFFRNFATKEDAIFPEHDNLLNRIEQRLAAAASQTQGLAVADAARLVLEHYLHEGDLARVRYRLTTTVPALQAREVAGLRQYQRLFTRFLARWWDGEPDSALRAELMAAAVVTAHNHVLRRWLRGETEAPLADFDHAIDIVLQQPSNDDDSTTVIVMRSGSGVDVVAHRLHQALLDLEAPAPDLD